MIWPTCHKIYAGLLDSVDLLYRGEADGPPKTSESPDAKPGGQSLAKAASGGLVLLAKDHSAPCDVT